MEAFSPHRGVVWRIKDQEIVRGNDWKLALKFKPSNFVEAERCIKAVQEVMINNVRPRIPIQRPLLNFKRIAPAQIIDIGVGQIFSPRHFHANVPRVVNADAVVDSLVNDIRVDFLVAGDDLFFVLRGIGVDDDEFAPVEDRLRCNIFQKTLQEATAFIKTGNCRDDVIP